MKHNWEYKKLDEVCTIKSGYTPSSDDLATDGDFPYFKVAEMNLSGNEKYLIHSPSYISGNIKTFPANSIVFPKNGAAVSTNKKRILQVASVVDLNTAVMIAHQNISAEYLYYILINIDFATLVKRGAVPTLNIPELKKINIPIPPMKVQEQIVAELDKINEVIADCRELLRNLDALAQSLFYDFFGDPITNPKAWKVKIVKEFAKVKIGPFGSCLHKEDYISGGTPLVNPIHMLNGYIKVDNDFTIDNVKREELINYLLKSNDIVLGRRGDIGRCALVTSNEDGYLCGTGSLFVRFSININPLFSLWCFHQPAISQYLIEKAKGATMLNINSGIIESIPLILPPLALQEQFAARIEQIEEQKKSVEQTISELQTLLDSRMDYWFN